MKKGTYEDQIRIEELEVYAHHGVYPEENEKGQHFNVNATLYTNTRPAGLADDLSLSTNYGEVCQFITEFMQQHTFLIDRNGGGADCFMKYCSIFRWYRDWIWRSASPRLRSHYLLAVYLWRFTGNGMKPILPWVPIWETAESISRRLWDSFRRTKTSEWKRCRSCWRHYLMAS